MYNKEWEQTVKSGIKKGDSHSFQLLYKRFYPGLCQIAYRYTGRSDIAEEIVQDTFLNIWKDREVIDIQGKLYSYLFSAVRNGSLNYIKHLIIERKFSAKTAVQFQKTALYIQLSQDDGSSLLIAEELEISLHKEIECLPPKCREIFLLSRKMGLKHSEIAEKLHVSEYTVQKQISIAIKKLCEKLLPKINLR